MINPEMNPNMQQFLRERRNAFLTLDEETIRAYMLKWNGDRGPPDPLVFITGVRKAITACGDLPLEFRKQAKAWLTERGFKSMDDGELL